jgi:hypothetical protein
MNPDTFRKLLAAVIGAALESGLHPALIHDALAVAGMELDDNRVEEPAYLDEDVPF